MLYYFSDFRRVPFIQIIVSNHDRKEREMDAHLNILRWLFALLVVILFLTGRTFFKGDDKKFYRYASMLIIVIFVMTLFTF